MLLLEVNSWRELQVRKGEERSVVTGGIAELKVLRELQVRDPLAVEEGVFLLEAYVT